MRLIPKRLNMSYSLNSLKRGYIGEEYIAYYGGEYEFRRLVKWETRSLDYGSHSYRRGPSRTLEASGFRTSGRVVMNQKGCGVVLFSFNG